MLWAGVIGISDGIIAGYDAIEATEDEARSDSHRPNTQLLAGTKEGVEQHRQERAIQPKHCRDAGDVGVRLQGSTEAIEDSCSACQCGR